MNKSDLILYAKEPMQLGKQHIAALKKVESDFPYFQGVQVLIAKGLSNLKHYEFNRQLHKSSLSVPDREVLFRYIHDISADIIKPVTPMETVREIIPAAEEMPVELPVITHEPVKEIEPEIPVEEISVDLVHEPEIVVSVVETPIEPPIEISEVVIESDRSTELEKHKSEFHSFSEWLQISKEGILPPEEELESAATIEATYSIDSPDDIIEESPIILPVTKDTTESKQVTNVEVFGSILDKFIQESPSISRPKAAFYNPANMAKQSVEEDEDLVTETLAKLYHRQGHYKKAIRAYEKLCLIYPHKMAYFADLIFKIKQESKD